MPSTNRLARWSRVAAIAAIPLMGVTLFVVVWLTQRGINSASDTVIRGEAGTLYGALRARLTEPGDLTNDDRVELAFAAIAPDGLRYVAMVSPEGELLAEAGVATIDARDLVRWIAATGPANPQRNGNRVRVVFGRKRAESAPVVGAPARQPPPPSIVLEFEPRVADQLATKASWLLAVGVLAALTLSLVAAVLVRWSLRREDTVRAIEQARRLATLGQMSAVLAHEIRNPLASLKGNAQLLAQTLPEGDRARAKADRVVAEATRLETLSNDLLEFARAGEIHVGDVDPSALLLDASAAVDRDRVTVDTSAAPRTWPLDAERIRQVLINLLENAAEISEGAVVARVAREDRSLVFTIRDHGPGVAEVDLPHVFEPFFTRRIRGTGLGLAVAKRLVELHGGTITARNADDGGAEFRITLPRT